MSQTPPNTRTRQAEIAEILLTAILRLLASRVACDRPVASIPSEPNRPLCDGGHPIDFPR